MGPVQAVASKAADKSAPETMIACDQAIFTSIRTPMGEGYRVIAASRGLQPDTRQTITRYSPSHGGLCSEAPARNDQLSEPEVEAVAFYPLPGDRLCVALSCFAGAEHTGRGGQRVYTHCAVLDDQAFTRFGYNPFHVARAMEAAGLTRPMLNPPDVLPELQLPLGAPTNAIRNLAIHPTLYSECRRYILQRLLDGRTIVIDTEDGWLEATEILLLGLPGPTRAQVSFSAGLQFSIGRRHRLHLLHDRTGQIKRRVAGQPIEVVDANSTYDTEIGASAWTSFVERHWAAGDVETLANRTSRAFADVSPPGRQRIGQLYNHIDEISRTDTAELLALAIEHLWPREQGVEREITEELANAAQRNLEQRFRGVAWAEVKPHWPALISTWKRSEKCASFAEPLIRQALKSAMEADPVDAARTALAVAGETHPAAGACGLGGTLDEVLSRLAVWIQQGKSVDQDDLRRLCDQWRALRPTCPIVEQISQGCTARTAD